ncbi:MAG TPA: acyl-CoA synthetase [Gammaproteobacteria bacterium]|jgi:fatty-acyl-CoA synthase|nr:acyl-CoA synthetase [Gammaproteobacteria bacterium]HIK72939.1 acyl-CoA synthetase [Gammaproteobacteria bacterium]
MEAHYATVFEKNADAIPNEIAVVCGENIRTWKEYDDRAARLATLLTSYGLGSDSKVGLYLHNSNEFLEAQYSVFKVAGVPINVNYRYKEEELIYLLDNSDSEAVFFQGCYAQQIESIKDKLDKVKVFIQVDDGTPQLECAENYEQIISSNEPMERFERSEDNIYMLYTGGTTGMPKGVMYTHGGHLGAMFNTAGAWGMIPIQEKIEIENISKEVLRISEEESLTVSIPACPLMHGTGMWLGALIPHLVGGRVVTMPQLGFDPDFLFKEVERTKVNNIVIVGDAFAKPMMDALDKAKAENSPYNLESVNTIISSGVMWSAEVKEGLLKHHEMVLIDAMGSTEGGMGSSVSSRDESPGTAKFTINPGVIVITDEGEHVEPGSGKMGKIGTSGLVPQGYFKDEKKSAETFKEFEGVRYSFPGDYALVEADGTITLLGRGSNCINTAGEKVYPEEVEEAVKRHPEIYDCLVVGLKDDRFGQRVVALASYQDDKEISEQDLIGFTREHLAGYKLPKQVLFVDEVMRAPNGKANYKWAKQRAEEELG